MDELLQLLHDAAVPMKRQLLVDPNLLLPIKRLDRTGALAPPACRCGLLLWGAARRVVEKRENGDGNGATALAARRGAVGIGLPGESAEKIRQREQHWPSSWRASNSSATIPYTHSK